MIGRIAIVALFVSTAALAQDVPGIEICTVDKTMERRTSCLQSNVDFLVKTINRLRGENELKLAAASREIAALRSAVTDLQKALAELQAAREAAATPAPTPISGPIPIPTPAPAKGAAAAK